MTVNLDSIDFDLKRKLFWASALICIGGVIRGVHFDILQGVELGGQSSVILAIDPSGRTRIQVGSKCVADA